MPKKGYKQTEEHKRKANAPHKIFSKKQEFQICKQYNEDKLSTPELAKKWNCYPSTIGNIIKRNGYVLRTNSECHLGQKRSEETKQKIREKTLLQMQTHPGPFKNTVPELKMKEILNELNILFEHQFILNNCSFDFHILNTSILIEVDGDYFHGNPKKFTKLNKMQLEMKERDKNHNKVAKENGFTLLRFWESDILNNTKKVIKGLENIWNK